MPITLSDTGVVFPDNSTQTTKFDTTMDTGKLLGVSTYTTAGTFTLLLDDVDLQTTSAVAANSTVYIDLKQVLATTKTIKGFASAVTIDFHISGVEIS